MDITITYTTGKVSAYEAIEYSFHEGYFSFKINKNVTYYIPFTNILQVRVEER